MAHLIYSFIPYKTIVKLSVYNKKSSHLVINILGMLGSPQVKINDEASKALAVICL